MQGVPDHQQPIEHRLVQHIDHQRMAADPAQRRTDGTAQRLHPGPAHHLVQIKPCPEQKQPGDQGELVGGGKTRTRKDQTGGEQLRVEAVRQLTQGKAPSTHAP